MALESLAILLLLFVHQVNCTADTCIGTCYTGRILPEPADIFHGKHLQGFSYKNITTDDPKKCYSSCIQDCRCKACQMNDARCELLDEDKTSKTEKFVEHTGYVYYDLKQTMYKGKSHMVPQGMCYNGCCRSQPCMNGGTCEEHCQSPKEKFSCKCTTRSYGKVCENQYFASCMDIMKSSKTLPEDGVYSLKRTDTNGMIPLYCAFVSPNQAWTLIESFAFSNKILFEKITFTKSWSYNRNAPPSWDGYRLTRLRIRHIRTNSTLFRATCDFPKRSGSLTPDLLIGNLSDVDIINERDIEGCKKYKLVNIRGHHCTDCTAHTAHGKSMPWHFHLDVTWGLCDFKPPYEAKNVDSFGYYATTDSVSKCTALPQSTTQWWLGQEN